MRAEDMLQLTLQDLLEALPENRRNLVIDIEDSAKLSNAVPITGSRSFELAQANDLVFCKSKKPKFIAGLVASKSRFMVILPEVTSSLPPGFANDRVLLITHKPRLLLALLLTPFASYPGITRQTVAINPEAQIAPDAIIGPGVVIGADVKIEAGCVVGPNTVITHSTIGPDTFIGVNCSIGTDGFGYEIDEETGEIIKFPHFGRVQIGSRVEISSNSCVARGSLKDTIIEDDVKIDNLVHVAHNCHIKRGALLTANAMVAGSTTVGEYAWVAPSTSLLNGITMGRCAMTGLGSVVTKPIESNAVVVGIPARKIKDRFSSDSKLLADTQ